MKSGIISSKVSALEATPSDRSKTTMMKEEAIEASGISDALLFGVAKEGLLAVKVKEECVDGVMREVREPDHVVRHKYFETMMRVKGYIRSDANVGAVMNFNLTVEKRREIRGRLEGWFGGNK